MNKYTSNSSKSCVFEVDLECSKELCKIPQWFSLAPDEIETKIEMLHNYQIKFADFYNIPINDINKLVPNLLDKDKS